MRMPPLRLILVLAALSAAPGCAWFDTLRGDGFQGWNQSLEGGGLRSTDPTAKPSGFFTDRRSDDIEKSLGGGF
jgi:hypothetical protein